MRVIGALCQSILGYKAHHRLEGLNHGNLCPHSSGSWILKMKAAESLTSPRAICFDM